ncbi:DUF2937 family protein [Notoacmeibacter sp. MSK16QG-6]|uniref:DUF2937 family protein n=1 Tax=Notoacmeibacter sp. MSK16QG-6 TaxID=2957982 RepID=UPI00209CBA70|nr:DUF2937 family protein [Notoacmeibacter sp. MSK16QG-6]MCP1199828.1 DUF2937 family protein [Notoacmeibacter sp. MSK16QG-6]
MLYRSFWLAAAVAAGVTASQAPEYAQQYRQRLGGALEELRAVIADFDRDAQDNGLSRDEALSSYDRADERFLNDRGNSMRDSLARLERLQTQSTAFAEQPPIAWPLIVARNPDPRLSEGAARDFRPAVPVTADGFVYAAAGGLIVAFLVSLLHRLSRPLRGKPVFGSRRAATAHRRR